MAIGAIAPRLGDLFRGRVAHPEVANEALLLEFDQGGERLSQRAGLRPGGIAESQVHQVEHLQAEDVEVLVDGVTQAGRVSGRRPAALLVPAGADLGHDVQRSGIGMQGPHGSVDS